MIQSDTMIRSGEVCRDADGFVDFDFYRKRATELRAQAMRDAFKLKATLSFMLITLALVVGAAIAASTPALWAYRA